MVLFLETNYYCPPVGAHITQITQSLYTHTHIVLGDGILLSLVYATMTTETVTQLNTA